MKTVTVSHNLILIVFAVVFVSLLILMYLFFRFRYQKLVYFDSLTHGYNFEAFKRDFDRKAKSGYVVAMDIDNFFSIENVCGAETADQIIIGVWNVIDSFFLKNDVFCRISGDNFAFYLEPRNEGDLEWQISNLVKKVREFAKNNQYPSLEMVFGVYQCSKDDQAQTAYLKAKYALKKMNHASRRYIYYYEEEDKFNQSIEDLILHGFKDAIENGEFVLEFQPKFDRKSGKIAGAESLVRWHHDGKVYYPNDIIKPLEKNGYIYQLDSYVFEEVVKFQARRMQQNLKIIPISVNISHRSLYYGNVVEEYRTLLRSYRVDSRLVPLEISGVSLDEDSRIIEITRRFSHHDFSLHIANYGVGNTPLAVLSEMDFDTVKIDRRIIKNIEDIKTNKIVRNIVNMARDLHKKVVVVGVENQMQSNAVKELGVDELQGFYYSKPMPEDEFSKLINGYINEPFKDKDGFSVIARESITTAYNLSRVSDGMLSLMIGTSGILVQRGEDVYISSANENLIKVLGIKCGNREKLDHLLPISDYLYQKEMPKLMKILDVAYNSGNNKGTLRFVQPKGSLYTEAIIFFKGESFNDREFYVFLTNSESSSSEHETISNLPYGLIKYRANTETILEMSDSLLKLFGYESFDEYRNDRGTSITTYIADEDYPVIKYAIKEQNIGLNDIIKLSYHVKGENGEKILVEDVGKMILHEETGYTVFSIINPLSEKSNAQLDLQKLKFNSTHDGLTGLLNQTAAHDMAQLLMQDHPNTEYAMMILDIDDFKKVNDTFGHSVGDKTIREFGRRIAELTNNSGICARIGGDEFMIIEPLVLEDEESAAKRIFKELRFDVDGYYITPSIGVSSTYVSERSYVDMFLNADRALYHTKKHGKNGYSIYSPEMPYEDDLEAEKKRMDSVTYDSIKDTVVAFAGLSENYLYVLDLTNERSYVSKNMEDNFNISNQDNSPLSKKLSKVVYADDYSKLIDSIDSIRKGDSLGHDFVYRWIDKNGTPLWVRSRNTAIMAEDKPKFVVGVVEKVKKR